ncbi:MAG TPA: hypothetical protein EYG81_05550, partial [Archaeoglobus profundus]|nr:hypothetical protein [Archaeoglobus profundus]
CGFSPRLGLQPITPIPLRGLGVMVSMLCPPNTLKNTYTFINFFIPALKGEAFSCKKEQILTKEDIKEYLTLALISIILIVVAAFIEAYITPKVAEYFLYKSFN